MQTIKKFVVLTCATWGMQASIAHADQATNAIYAEKGQLVIHLGNVPDKYQNIQVPVWSDQNGQDDLIWYPVERSDKGFDLQVPLTNHSDQAGLYHVHVYGVEANEQLTGLYPLTTSVQQKDLASSPALLKEWEDEVITAGWAYGGGHALKGKELKLVVTTGSDAAKYRKDGEYSHTMEELLSPFEVVAYKVGMNYAEPFLVQGTATIGDAELDQAAADYVSAILD